MTSEHPHQNNPQRTQENICGHVCQKQVSRAGTSNYIPHTVGCNDLSMPLIPASGTHVLISKCNYIEIVSVFSVLKATGESITFELQMTPMESDFTHETLVRSEVECALTCQTHRGCTRFSYPAEDNTCYFDAVDEEEYYITVTEIEYVTEVVYVEVWIV